jgi:hypothetical protein
MAHQPEHAQAESPNQILDWIAVHRKLIAFVIGIAITAAVHVWGTSNAWVSFAVLVATGLGVYGVPNKTAPKKDQTVVG